MTSRKFVIFVFELHGLSQEMDLGTDNQIMFVIIAIYIIFGSTQIAQDPS